MRELGTGSDTLNIKNSPLYVLWVVWIIWLPLLASPILRLNQSSASPLRIVVMLTGVTVYIGLYMSATWHNVHNLVAPIKAIQIPVAQWLTIAICMLLSVVLGVLGHGQEWLDPFVLTSAYVGSSLPPRRAASTIGVLLLLILATGWLGNLSAPDYVTALLFVTVVGVTTIGVARSIIISQELRNAREEIAHLAVMNERLRIARDLHDLLGHNLSLIALKSELARRLMAVSPERAAIEINDVEHVARTTLQEVREAVGRYRQATLSTELHGAKEILAAAGIAYRYEGDEQITDALTHASEAVLAWAVREGVTNVIRHSRAHQCTIRLTHDRNAASVEVLDDGIGTSPEFMLPSPDKGIMNTADNGGNGLRGLTERVAALGGRVEAGFCAGGGFRVAVSVPLGQKNRQVGMPAVPSQ